MRIRRTLLMVALACAIASGLPRPAAANPWTRDPGKFYLGLTYSFIVTKGMHDEGFEYGSLSEQYMQHVVDAYLEVGLVERWLTLMVQWTLFRSSSFGSAVVTGMGDLRLGLWTGLVGRPVKLAIGVIAGFPTGEPVPGQTDAQNRLPTGDGEFDVELALGFGYFFGGAKRYPLHHYFRVQAAYWLRTTPRKVVEGPRRDYSDAFRWSVEIGIKFPWRFIRRFWFIVRAFGTEYFWQRGFLDQWGGMQEGTTVTGVGFDIRVRLYKGLEVYLGFEGGPRARLLPTGPQFKLGLSYTRD